MFDLSLGYFVTKLLTGDQRPGYFEKKFGYVHYKVHDRFSQFLAMAENKDTL